MNAYTYARDNGKALHIMGLTSTGGVHSSQEHLMALCDIAKQYELEKVYVHCFMDGRDTDPESGKGFVNTVIAHCQQSAGTVATVIGRYYAMDRNNNWDRIKVAYDMLTAGIGRKSDDMVRAIQESYDEGVTDEFIKPIVNTTVD